MIDFNLTVSRSYIGEFLDAKGLEHALEEEGYEVKITEIDPTNNIKKPVDIPPCKVNINFHSSYHLAENAEQNFLFYHEIHDKTGAADDNLPLQTFMKYQGVFTPAKKFAEELGIDHLQMAADPYYYRKIPYKKVPKKYKCDVVFIGNNHKDRDSKILTDILAKLVEKYKVHVYGEGWDIPEAKGLLPLADAKYAYSGAKVGINVGGAGMQKWGLGTNRLYQMGACGLVTVSYPCDDYLEAYGESDLIFRNDTLGMIESIELLLENDLTRKDFSKRFLYWTTNHHLWKHRVQDLLNIIENPKRDFRSLPLSNEQIDESRSTDLVIGIPGEVEDFFTLGMMNAVTMGVPQVKYDIFMPKRSFNIADARNKMCQELMDGKYRYLLMVDTDLYIPGHTIDYLLENVDKFDLDIVCGYYHRIEENNKVLPHFHVEVDGIIIQPGKFHTDRLIRAYNAPPGLMMISRRVIQTFYDEGIKEPFVLTPQMGEGPYFCELAKQLGFKIYIDPRVVAIHIKNLLLNEDGTVDYR